jgi:hypothetical protein
MKLVMNNKEVLLFLILVLMYNTSTTDKVRQNHVSILSISCKKWPIHRNALKWKTNYCEAEDGQLGRQMKLNKKQLYNYYSLHTRLC